MSLKRLVKTYKPKVGTKFGKYGKVSSTVIRKPKEVRHRKGVPSFRSKFEKEFWDAQHSKIGLRYEPFALSYSVIEERRYTPDFIDADLFRAQERIRIYETKGLFTPTDRKKMKHVRDSNPDIELIMVFQRDNYLTKAKNRKYSTWCEENRINYCIGVDLRNIVWAANPNRLAAGIDKKKPKKSL